MGRIKVYKKYMEQEQKILTKEELDTLRELNNKYNSLMFSIGEVNVVISDLSVKLKEAEKEKEYLLSDYNSLKQKSEELTAKLSDKYGSAKINLDTGKIESI